LVRRLLIRRRSFTSPLLSARHDADDWDSKSSQPTDEVRLDMARRHLYGTYALREVPEDYITRHLIRVDHENFTIRPETSRLVTIRHLNLNDRQLMRTCRDMDFIFCRNVLIYFDDATRQWSITSTTR
jgi:chemotaxis methyl-accepting protein methylase